MYMGVVVTKALNKITKYPHFYPFMTEGSMNYSTVPDFGLLNILSPEGLLLPILSMYLTHVLLNRSVHPFLVGFRTNYSMLSR